VLIRGSSLCQGAPTTFINGTLYAMGGTQLLATVTAILENNPR